MCITSPLSRHVRSEPDENAPFRHVHQRIEAEKVAKRKREGHFVNQRDVNRRQSLGFRVLKRAQIELNDAEAQAVALASD